MNLDKVKTFVGFAIKSRSVIYGVDQIKEKNVKVIFFSSDLSESSKISCKKIAEKNNIKYYQISSEEMFQLVGSEKIKAFAILNIDLAKAIESNM